MTKIRIELPSNPAIKGFSWGMVHGACKLDFFREIGGSYLRNEDLQNVLKVLKKDYANTLTIYRVLGSEAEYIVYSLENDPKEIRRGSIEGVDSSSSREYIEWLKRN